MSITFMEVSTRYAVVTTNYYGIDVSCTLTHDISVSTNVWYVGLFLLLIP